MVEVVKFKCPKCGRSLSVTQSNVVKVVGVLCAYCSTVSWLTPEGEIGKGPSESESSNRPKRDKKNTDK